MTPPCVDREAFLDETLMPDRAVAFETHLVACPECRRTVELWRSQKTVILRWAEPTPADSQAVMRLIAQAHSAAPSFRFRVLTLAGVLAVAVIAVVFLVARPRPVVLVAGAEPRTMAIGADRLTLWAGSRAELWQHGRDTRVRATGALSFRVAKRSAGEHFVVEAGPFEVRVVGTVFHVSVGATATIFVSQGVIEVWKGAQQVARLKGGEAFDEAGQRAARDDELSVLEGPPAVNEGPATEPDAGIAEPEPPKPGAPRLDAAEITRAMVEGRLADATRLVTAHLARAPNDGHAWLFLGDIRRKLNALGPAVTAYRRAIAVGDVETRNRARFLAASMLQDSMGEANAARLLLEAYLLAPAHARSLEAPVLVRLARLDLAAKATLSARRRLELVLSRHPTTPAAVEARELLSHLP